MLHLQPIMFGFILLAVLDSKEIWDALAAVGITKEKTELYTGIDRRQFARQLDGPEHLRHATLEKLPLSFHREYHWRMVLKVGLPEQVQRSLPLLLAVAGEKPMAKMNLPEEQKAEKSA